jgi:hypothetical protein
MIPVARLGLLAGIEDQPETLDTPLDDAFTFLVRICLVEHLQNYHLRLHPLVREFAERLIAKENRAAFLDRATVNVYNAYKDLFRLEREYIVRGIDSVIDDIQVAIACCKTGAQHVEDLTTIQRILDRERHNLRVDATLVQRDTFLLQQLHYRAHCLGVDSLAKKCCAALATKDTQVFKMCGSGGFEDPAGIRTFKGHSGSVRAVSMREDGKVAISGSSDDTLILWDVATGRILRRLFVKHPVLCLSMARTRGAFGDTAGLVQFFELIG